MKEITYLEAEELVRKYLKSLKNLSEYSRNKNINYQSLSIIKNGNNSNKMYSTIVFNILKELNYSPKRITVKRVSYEIHEAKK